jgi:DNA replication and repair protein RecF
VIVGHNAIGKTNLLEAMYALATGKSFRAKRDNEIIRWDEEVGRIKGLTGEDEVEIVLTAGNVGGRKTALKKYLVNGVPRRMYDALGRVRAVLFWPEDLELITDSPSIRRNYLNAVLVQVDREYRRTLLSYERGVRQRNKLLERINEGLASRSQLIFWNQLLIKAGGFIMDGRDYAEDYDLWLRLGKQGIMHNIDKPMVKYLVKSSNGLSYKLKFWLKQRDLIQVHKRDYPNFLLADLLLTLRILYARVRQIF